MGGTRPEEANRRVCIVRHNYYPSELNVKREAETLARAGYEVAVICLRGEGEAAREKIGGVEIHRMPVGHKRGKLWRYAFEYNAFFILASFKLLTLHVKKRFQFIQVNTMPDALVFVALVPKLFGTKVIQHMHEPMPELFGTMFSRWYHSIFIFIIKVAEKLSLKFADRSLTVTREMRDNFGRRGADINKITVIVNVPDDDLFKRELIEHLSETIEKVKKEERRKGVFRIICHGAIEERYGLDVMVRAVHKVKNELPGIQFRFLGKGDYLDEILNLADELRVKDNVTYLGFVPFEEMVQEILTADVGIVPAKKNPYSVLVHTNKMYEYIALGKPVIASKLDAVVSYFPEDSLIYFNSGDYGDLAEKIFYVYAHPEEVEKRMMKVGEIYETYRWEREKKKYLGVYHALSSEGMAHP